MATKETALRMVDRHLERACQLEAEAVNLSGEAREAKMKEAWEAFDKALKADRIASKQ